MAALSVVALIFFVSAGVLLTLALYFVMAPLYGVPQTLLILGAIHLGVALLLVGAILLDRPGSSQQAAAVPAAQFQGSAVTALTAAFFSGLSQGVAANGQHRPAR